MSFVSFSADESEYAYLYGRVSGMEGKLLPEREVEALIQARSDAEVIASLESTEYGPYLCDLKFPEYTAFDVEERLFRHMKDVFDEVRAITPEKEREAFQKFFTGLWSHKNMKTILRGIHHRLPSSEVTQLLNPLGDKDSETLSRLAGEDSVRGFLEDAGFFEEKTYKAYEDSGRLELLESFLDSAFFKKFAHEFDGTQLEDYVSVYADLLNIINVLRCRRYGIDATPYLVEGGVLPAETLRKASLAEISELPSLFSKTPYGEFAASAVRRYSEEDSLSFVENEAQAYLRGIMRDKAVLNPLSVYPAAQFIELKLAEIKAIKAIILSKREGLTPEETRKAVSEVCE
jgi:vacuolar-type H+-ATPase subunit C/Vma6